MKHYSIRRHLLVLLLGSLIAVGATMLGVGYHTAREEIHELADARLQQGARTLLMLDLKRLARLAGSGEKDTEDHDNHAGKNGEVSPLAFQVWGDDGRLLLASRGAPLAPYLSTEGYATRRINRQDWRSFSARDHKRNYQVTVLEPLSTRDHPVAELAGHMSQVLAISLPLLALLIWLGIHRGLRPLLRLSGAIATRDALNMEPIHLEQVPNEVTPLVTALNNLLQRLNSSLDRERAFTADAAHELRTPLAAIKVQAEVALAAQDESTRRQAIEQVITGVNRTTHLAQQLLLLARLEQSGHYVKQAVDLAKLAANSVATRADEANHKGIDCSLDADTHCIMQGDPTMLAVLIDNLLDNAIKYGNNSQHILVSVKLEAKTLRLSVADDGDGVEPSLRNRLRDRFFRAEGQSVSGSGLGLSIVEKIARAHDGSVEIGPGLNGRGLGVKVQFPTYLAG